MAEIRFNTGVGIVSFDTAGGTGNPGSPIRSKVEVSNNPGVNVLSMPAVGFASSLPEGVNTIGSVGFAGHQFQTYNGLEGLGGAYVATTVDATAGNDFWLINFPGPQLEAGYAVLDWWNVSGTDPALDLTFSQNVGKHWQLKLASSNLLAAKTTLTLDSENREDRIVTQYTDSRLFSVSGTYTF